MSPYYFPKDKAYLEVEEITKKMRMQGVDSYEYGSKTDPSFLPNLIKLGFFSDIIKSQEARKLKDIALRVWKGVLQKIYPKLINFLQYK